MLDTKVWPNTLSHKSSESKVLDAINSKKEKKELEIKDISKLDFDTKWIYRSISRTAYGMSWGIHNPSVYKDSVLSFKVQWFLHRWYVYVSLDYNDTFTVTLTKNNRTTIKEQHTWIYIDELIPCIDWAVEHWVSDEEYEKKVKKSLHWVV